MKNKILVSYLAQPMGGPPSGLRVWQDGSVELNAGTGTWKHVTQLGSAQLEQLRQQILAAQLFSTPATVPAPAGMQDGSSCRWQASLEDQQADVLVQGWSDENPAAGLLRNLVMQMYVLISAAQMGKAI